LGILQQFYSPAADRLTTTFGHVIPLRRLQKDD